MTLEDIKKLRTALTLNNTSRILEVICDNGIILKAISDYLIWDDDNQILIAFYTESESYLREKPIAVISTEYEHIQYLKTNISIKQLDDMFKLIEDSGTPLNNEDKAKYKKYYNELYSTRDLARDPDELKGYL